MRSACLFSGMAASTLGKCPRVLMILGSRAFTLSIALVVQITRRTSGGKAKNGITLSRTLRQDATTVGNLALHWTCSKVSSSACAASTLGAV